MCPPYTTSLKTSTAFKTLILVSCAPFIMLVVLQCWHIQSIIFITTVDVFRSALVLSAKLMLEMDIIATT